ncbi:hypothetical protein [Endozoicomonas sp. Mp262]|uniref:hypothetical protein n=1 Tax=Endozoicomonas sp. Mp262 TaxID=2919499 RepID=UPI0021D96DC6
MKGIIEILSKQAAIARELTEQKHRLPAEEQKATPPVFGFSDGDEVQIERFCRIICYGMSTPFPRSQQQLGYAVIGLKKALKKLSLVELLNRSPNVALVTAECSRPEVKPLPQLDNLLHQDLLQKALPNLRQAVRFMHERDQQDIYSILQLKVGYLTPPCS